jgi:hypothetical protein
MSASRFASCFLASTATLLISGCGTATIADVGLDAGDVSLDASGLAADAHSGLADAGPPDAAASLPDASTSEDANTVAPDASERQDAGERRDAAAPDASCTIDNVTGADTTARLGGADVPLSFVAKESPASCLIDETILCAMASGYTSGCGAVTPACVYVPPGTSPARGECRVVGWAAVDPTKKATVTITIVPSTTELGAFPGCQGSGCRTRAGFANGSTVYLVTSLNDGTAAGTLGACIAASGPRVCLFKVAGRIQTSGYTIRNGGLTIDGRSAPGDGVTISGKGADSSAVALLYPKASDVVIRGLKLRQGRNAAFPADGSPARPINIIGADVHNHVYDGNSITWGNGGQVSVWGGAGRTIRDMTFSWNIIGECLSTTGASGYGYNINTGGTGGSADRMTDMDFHHNYLPSGCERNPAYKMKRGRIVNNVIFNWERSDYLQTRGGADTDIVGNVTKPGPNSSGSDGTGVTFHGQTIAPTEIPVGQPTAYMEGNIGQAHPTTSSGDNWTSGYAHSSDQALSGYKRSPYAPLSAPTSGFAITADSAGTMATPVGSVVGSDWDSTGINTNAGVLGLAGAVVRIDCGGKLVMRRDAADSRVANYYANPSNAPHPAPQGESGYGGFPSAHYTVSGTCAAGSRDNSTCACSDTDADGIPDFWESAKCGSATGCSPTATTIMAPFTDLEAYLSGFAPAP